MNVLTGWYRRYRGWEDRHIDLLDTLNRGQEPGPEWQRTHLRRRLVASLRARSTIERQQLRDYTWRFRGWRSLLALATLVAINSVIGAFVHFAAPDRFGLVEAVLLLNTLVLAVGFAVVGAWFSPEHMFRLRGRAYIVVPLLATSGAIFGATISALVSGENVVAMFARAGRSVIVAGVGFGLAMAVVLGAVAMLRNRELRALNAQLGAEAERERLATEVAASRLRLLQAQIEPHFLFNTLGAVQQLAEGRAPEAAALTAHLIRFLRDSLGSFSRRASTLGDELAVIESYLEIMRSRLGERLAYTIDVTEDLRACPVQPTLLLSFVENAIKHGIEPSPRGGTIRVAATRANALLTIEVADTGVGLGDTVREGHGLSNVREQLALAYDGRATLELVENEPSGLVVVMTIPCEHAA